MLVKKLMLCFILCHTALFGSSAEVGSLEDLIAAATENLQQFNIEYKTMWWWQQSTDWSYSTNISASTASAREFVSEAFSEWMRKWKLWARAIDTSLFPDEHQRVINIIASGVVIMNDNDARLLTSLKSKLTQIYSSAEIKIPDSNLSAKGEIEVNTLMANIRQPQILKQAWKLWREQVGERAKPLLFQLFEVANQASQENGYSNVGESWKEELGLADTVGTTLKLWNEVKSFYKEIHAYTRHKLQKHYGNGHFNENNLIPAHILGSIWGENWVQLFDLLMPYPDHPLSNITNDFLAKNYSVSSLAHKAEAFYTTMGFGAMKESFWKKSMLVKPEDSRLVDCHAVSYDFALDEDYRIRMCGEVKEKSFLEMIHELGHIQYYKAYHHLPMIYRNGANSAFHEAVGETMVYAAQSPKCLSLLKVTEYDAASKEELLNILMKQALSKFILLPWTLTVEMWRYMVFAGDVTEENMTKKWWELRKLFQGIEPPDQEASKLFDPGSKYHVINNIPYMRYFLSRFLEHQFLDALCQLSDEDIHSCCFIASENAARKLKNMLSLGASVSWEDALESLTGQRYLSSNPLMKYYRPLHLWLIEYNESHNIRKS